MEKYESLEMDVVVFDTDDVIRTSGGGDTDTEEFCIGGMD